MALRPGPKIARILAAYFHGLPPASSALDRVLRADAGRTIDHDWRTLDTTESPLVFLGRSEPRTLEVPVGGDFSYQPFRDGLRDLLDPLRIPIVQPSGLDEYGLRIVPHPSSLAWGIVNATFEFGGEDKRLVRPYLTVGAIEMPSIALGQVEFGVGVGADALRAILMEFAPGAAQERLDVALDRVVLAQACNLTHLVLALHKLEEPRRLKDDFLRREARRKRAWDAFESYLSVEQLEEWREYFFVTVKSQRKRLYRIIPKGSYNVFRLAKSDNRATMAYCAIPRMFEPHREDGYPLGDILLMQLLMLRHDEDKFLETANRDKRMRAPYVDIGRFVEAIDYRREFVAKY